MLTLFRLFFMTSICTLLYFANQDYKDFFYYICGIVDSMSSSVGVLVFVIIKEKNFNLVYFLKLSLCKLLLNLIVYPFLYGEYNIIDLLYMHRWYTFCVFLIAIN